MILENEWCEQSQHLLFQQATSGLHILLSQETIRIIAVEIFTKEFAPEFIRSLFYT